MDKGLTVLYEVALTEAEQLKLVIERSKTQTHISHASGSGADKGTEDNDDEVNVSEDDDTDDDDNQDDNDDGHDDQDADATDDQDKDDQDAENPNDDNEQTDSDNNGDDFVHPKFSTHDEEEREEESFDPRVQTPSHVESTDDEDDDEEVQGVNIKGKEIDEEANNQESERNELYRDLNVNLEGRDVEMTDTQPTNVQTTQVTEDTYVIITLVIPEGQQQSSSMSFGFVSNMLIPRPDTCIDSIFTLNTEATSLVDVPVTTIAEPPLMSATALPLPPTPLITHMQQTPVPTPTTVPSSSLQDLPNFGSLFGDEAQAENEDFLNKLDDNIKKIIKDQVKEQVNAQVSKIFPKIKKTVNEQLEAKVMTRSSTESKTSLAIAANLSELELKKILIDKMESNKSIHRSDEQKNLYKALVEAYKSDKLILDSYGDIENTPKTTGKSTKGSKSQHKSAGESAHAKEPMHTAKDLEEPAHQEFDIGATEDQSDEETYHHPDWFQKPAQLPTPDRDWNKTLPAVHGPVQPWLSNLDWEDGPPRKLLEEVYKATTDQLDWNNPKGQQYPHDLRKPLPLIPNSHGRQVIPFDHFINNDLAYLSGSVSSRTYATFVTKTQAADYGHIKWIEDLVPNTMWSKVPVNYDKHALWGISHWGRKHQQFYGFAANRESAHDVYSKRRIIAVTKLQLVEWHGYKHLDWITVRRDDDKLYTFKEGDFKRLCLQDIKDMLIILVQGKLTNLNVEDRLAFGVFMRMFTRSIVIQRRVEDLQLDSILQAGNPVKEILLKLNLPDHRTLKDGSKVKEFQRSLCHSDTERLSRSDEVLKLKNFKKDATLKLSKSTNQEWYEHVGPEVTRSQDDKSGLLLISRIRTRFSSRGYEEKKVMDIDFEDNLFGLYSDEDLTNLAKVIFLIPVPSMPALADKSHFLSGGDNKPPMLEKHLYDSWKSIMELYMMNRPHGRMILASVEKGPLVWPSITVDGVTRLKEYTELTPAEAIQADYDIKEINIIL
ncbi:hypothetical protein Tco_1282169 [Tanacetum coccineum]